MPKLTDKQAALVKTLLSGGDETIANAISASGFPALAIATFMGWSWTDLNRLSKEGKRVSELPKEWRDQLRAKAVQFGLT